MPKLDETVVSTRVVQPGHRGLVMLRPFSPARQTTFATVPPGARRVHKRVELRPEEYNCIK